MNWQQRPELWRLFQQPTGASGLENPSLSIQAKSPAGGQLIELDLQLRQEPECVVAAAGFRCFGGVVFIASGAWLCERIIGLTYAEVQALRESNSLLEEIQAALQLSPTEIPAAMLMNDVIQQLIDAWPAA